jgi:glycosyltransferase involved in cell wall biosynthesis
MSDRPLFTIFTATFNRAHTLHRVFEGLQAQTLKDFEWLIIDDGSTDDTAELVAAWQKVARFEIRYVRQQHAGKHIAHNRALKEARGRFFVVADSDDGLLPHALDRIYWHWNTIPESRRDEYWAIAGLACDENGKIVGDQFPSSPFDSNFRDLHYVHQIRGEKFYVSPTDILRKYPFPEIPGTQFVPEAVIWFEIAKTYRHRAVNEVCRVYYRDQTEAGAKLSSRKNMPTTARGRLYYYIWLLNNDIEYFFRSPRSFLKAALMMPTASYYSGRPWGQTWRALKHFSGKCLVFLVLPLALLVCLWYRLSSAAAARA